MKSGHMKITRPALLLTAMLCGGNVHAQPPVAAEPVLELRDAGNVPLHITPALLQSLARHTLQVEDHGRPARFEGVSLRDLLEHAGAPLGPKLRGAMMGRYLQVSAADGYQTVFALAELDAATGNRFVLLADRRDGQPLSAHEGPYRLIVPEDRRAARWVRQVNTLRLHDVSRP